MGFNYALFLSELEAATTIIPFNESIPQTMRMSIAETLESQSNDENDDIELILAKIKAKVVRERIQVDTQSYYTHIKFIIVFIIQKAISIFY